MKQTKLRMLHMHVSVQWHNEIDDAYVYEMKCTFVEAKHLGCYTLAYTCAEKVDLQNA